jgi:hypothetical protein
MSVWAMAALPVIDGAVVLAGTPITCAVAALATPELNPAALVAFTVTATNDPPSEDCNVYVLDVAPEIFEQLVSLELEQSSHW